MTNYILKLLELLQKEVNMELLYFLTVLSAYMFCIA